MASQRQYIVRTPNGEKYGPAEQEVLVKWAKTNRISASCEVRSTLIDRWEPAYRIPFLREIIAEQAAEEEDEGDPSFLTRVARLATRKATKDAASASLNQPQLKDFKPAPVMLRMMSGITDAVVVAAYLLAVYLVMALVYSGGFDGELAFYLGFIIAYCGVVFYFVYCVAKLQTVGNKLWGILVVRSREEELYMGGAFLFTVFMFAFGLLTPLIVFLTPSSLSFQEMFSGTRVVKMKMVTKRVR